MAISFDGPISDDQVKRMVKDPKSNSFIENFAEQWFARASFTSEKLFARTAAQSA